LSPKGDVVDFVPSQDPEPHGKLQAYEIITPSVGSEIRRMQTLTEEVTGKQASCHLKPKTPPVGALDLHKYKMHSLLERLANWLFQTLFYNFQF
jgi:hypothetical protein